MNCHHNVCVTAVTLLRSLQNLFNGMNLEKEICLVGLAAFIR